MNNSVKTLIDEAVQNMINHTSEDKVIKKLTKKHAKKIHFIPKKYRVFGGILQSMNIQFGNFIEELMAVIISKDDRYEIIEKYSGKKNIKFNISKSTENIIDNYITRCQLEDDFDLYGEFLKLLNQIIDDNSERNNTIKHDIDLLFRDKENDIYYYLEIKYNDDHDSDKFIGISRKFIKTSAYLLKELNIESCEKFKPILFYFNNKKRIGNIYIPEETNIYRGKKFFNEFLDINYEDLEEFMSNLSENNSTIMMFDELYEKIVNYNNENI